MMRLPCAQSPCRLRAPCGMHCRCLTRRQPWRRINWLGMPLTTCLAARSRSHSAFCRQYVTATPPPRWLSSHVYRNGAEAEMVVADLLNIIHQASLAAAGADLADLMSERPGITALGDLALLGRAWQMLLKGHEEVSKAPNPAAAFEMLVIRLAHTATCQPRGHPAKAATRPSCRYKRLICCNAGQRRTTGCIGESVLCAAGD